jgi:hypothetical protein
MEIVNLELLTVQENFPDQSQRIEQLYRSDPDFKALCADYFLSQKTLQQFQKEYNHTVNAIQEYQDICRDLEKELGEFIRRHPLQ